MEVTIYKSHLKDSYPTILIQLSEVSFADLDDFYYNTPYSAIPTTISVLSTTSFSPPSAFETILSKSIFNDK